MEIGLFAALLTGSLTLVGWYTEADPAAGGRRLRVLAILLFLAALARPEAVPAVGLITLGVALLREAPHSRRRRMWVLGIAPAAALITVGVNLVARGVPGTNALAAKAIWSEPRPDVLAGVLERLPVSFANVSRAIVTDGFNPSWGGLAAPLLETLLWIGFAGSAVLAWRSGSARAPVRIALGVLLLAAVSGLVPVVYATHYYRYQMPYMPLALAVVLWGWYQLFPRGSRLPFGVGLVVLALLAPGLPRMITLGARNAANMAEQQVAGARWIDANLPEDAIVGINDAGCARLLRQPASGGSDRSRDQRTGARAPGGSGLALRVAGAGAGGGPPHPLRDLPELVPVPRAHEPDRRRRPRNPAHRQHHLGGDLKSFHRADWSRVDPENRLVTRANLLDLWGFEVVDELDVGSLTSQAAHGYRALPTWRDLLREYPVERGSPIVRIDGGRLVREEERFTLRCRPGVPGALVLRTEPYREFALRVTVDGRDAGTLHAPRRSLLWSEVVLDLPGELFTAETAEFRLRYEGSDPEGYPSFHYWLLQ